ncbi:alpha/beta hydrolase fold domain-containing protein [Streptomyces sp. NPDC054854]
MTAARRTRLSRFTRRATVSFTAGMAMGAACWGLGLTAPAPTLLGLAGLLGVGIGERAATACGTRLAHRRSRHRPPRPARQLRRPHPSPREAPMPLTPDLAAFLAPPAPERLPFPPAARPTPGVRVLRGVPYAYRAGIRPLELDLWLPDETHRPLPVILYLHGGGWRAGTRTEMGPRFRHWSPDPFARLAQAGFAVASVDYRLSGEAVHPAQLDDATAALGWLTARAGELGLDARRIVTWGESAGAHLAALLALTVPLSGCVAWYGPTDLTTLPGQCPPGTYDAADPTTREALLIGAAIADAPDRARAASPVAHVHADAPPFLVLHGTEDTLIPLAQGEQLAAALLRVGARVDFRPVLGAEHGWEGLAEDEVERCFTTSVDFAHACTAGPLPPV